MDILYGYFPALRDQLVPPILLWMADGFPVYSFGVEIEIIARPHRIKDLHERSHAEYYRDLSDAIKARLLSSASDPLPARGYQKHPEHYDKWWITKDGSLKISDADKSTLVPVEAVSPVLKTMSLWENEIHGFWQSYADVFAKPEHSVYCGSHVHVARGRHAAFTLAELKTIAFGIAVYEDIIGEILVAERRGNPYCRPNTAVSGVLGVYRGHWRLLAKELNGLASIQSLCLFMQKDSRYVLWNFQNTLPGKSGTIEFRGGPCLRGPVRTSAWMAFTVGLVHWILAKKHIHNPDSFAHYTAAQLYAEVRGKAKALAIGWDLPPRYTQLNGTEEWEADD